MAGHIRSQRVAISYRTGKCPWVTGGTGYRPCDRINALALSVECLGDDFVATAFVSDACSRPLGLWKGSSQVVVGHSNERTQDHYVHIDRDNMRNLMGKSVTSRFTSWKGAGMLAISVMEDEVVVVSITRGVEDLSRKRQRKARRLE